MEISQTNRMTTSLILPHLLNVTVLISVINPSVTSSPLSTLMTSTVPSKTPDEEESRRVMAALENKQGEELLAAYSKTELQSTQPKGGNPDILETINKHFAKVIDPLAIAIGIVGNALLALVFLITPLRLRPLSHLVAGLGVVNLLYTLSYMLVYLTNIGVEVYKVPGICQVSSFILPFSRSLEAWYIFISHLDRLRAHTTSGRDRRRSRVFKTKFAIVLSAILVAAPFLHVLWSVETKTFAGTTYCMPMRETLYIHTLLRKMEIIGSVLLPLTLTTGIGLMLGLKAVVYRIFKDDIDEDMEPSNNGSAYASSFGEDKILHMPLQEKVFQKKEDSPKFTSPIVGLTTINEQSFSFSDSDCHHQDVTPAQCHQAMQRKISEERDLSPVVGSRKDTILEVSSTPSSSPKSTHSNSSSSDPTVLEETSTHSSGKDNPEASNYSSEKQLRESPTTEGHANVLDKDSNNSSGLSDASEATKDSSRTGKRYSAVNLVLSSLKISNWRRRRNLQVSFQEDGDTYERNPSRCSSASNISQVTSVSMSHWQTYSFASYNSNGSRLSQSIPEDHEFPDDAVFSTVTTLLMGLIFAVLILPMTFSQAAKLFLEVQPSRPTPYAIQQAIFFESLIKLNAVYKFLMCALMMPSFRYAIVWLLTHWIPSKITRMSSICMCGSGAEKVEMVHV